MSHVLYHPTIERLTLKRWTRPNSRLVDRLLTQREMVQTTKKGKPESLPS